MANFKDLRKLRVGAGLTKDGLASKAGVGRDLIRKAENGGDCMVEKLHAVFNALNVHYTTVGRPLDPTEFIIDG